MTDVYFHYSNAHGVLIDRSRTAVDDLVGARKHTDCVARSLIMTASAEDGAAGSSPHVTDNEGDEIFTVPVATVLGRPH
jgi:hypothetical protein